MAQKDWTIGFCAISRVRRLAHHQTQNHKATPRPDANHQTHLQALNLLHQVARVIRPVRPHHRQWKPLINFQSTGRDRVVRLTVVRIGSNQQTLPFPSATSQIDSIRSRTLSSRMRRTKLWVIWNDVIIKQWRELKPKKKQTSYSLHFTHFANLYTFNLYMRLSNTDKHNFVESEPQFINKKKHHHHP